MIEAELKAKLANPSAVRQRLRELAGEPEKSIYADTYFDNAVGELEQAGRELRLRTVETPDSVRHLFTFKEPAVDEASGSKPEYESAVANRNAVEHTVKALGYVPLVELTKDCENFELSRDGRQFLASIVRVPELADTFLEVETMADEGQVNVALGAVRAVLAELGVTSEELTTELYVDAVRGARAG